MISCNISCMFSTLVLLLYLCTLCRHTDDVIHAWERMHHIMMHTVPAGLATHFTATNVSPGVHKAVWTG